MSRGQAEGLGAGGRVEDGAHCWASRKILGMRVAAPYAVLNPEERLRCWNDCVVLLCGVYIRFLNMMF